MAADRHIDRTMVHASTAADTAEHVLKLPAEHAGTAIIQKYNVIFAGAVGIA